MIDHFNDILFVSLGAAFGANTRFLIYKRLEKINLSKDFIILSINTFSSFCVGFFFSIASQTFNINYSNQLKLFFLVGFLGSLSTFSTFIYDLFDLSINSKLNRVLKLFFFSLTLGVIALSFGFLLSQL